MEDFGDMFMNDKGIWQALGKTVHCFSQTSSSARDIHLSILLTGD